MCLGRPSQSWEQTSRIPGLKARLKERQHFTSILSKSIWTQRGETEQGFRREAERKYFCVVLLFVVVIVLICFGLLLFDLVFQLEDL